MLREGGVLNYLILSRNRTGVADFLVRVLLLKTLSSEWLSLFAGTTTFFLPSLQRLVSVQSSVTPSQFVSVLRINWASQCPSQRDLKCALFHILKCLGEWGHVGWLSERILWEMQWWTLKKNNFQKNSYVLSHVYVRSFYIYSPWYPVCQCCSECYFEP